MKVIFVETEISNFLFVLYNIHNILHSYIVFIACQIKSFYLLFIFASVIVNILKITSFLRYVKDSKCVCGKYVIPRVDILDI